MTVKLLPKICLLLSSLAPLTACHEGETAEADRNETVSATTPEKPTPPPAPRPIPVDLGADEKSADTKPNSSADIIAAIQAEYKRIRTLADAEQLRPEEKVVACRNQDGEGRLTRYYEGDKLVMLEYITGIGHAFITKRMYFKDGQLFFVFVEDGSWSPGGPVVDGMAGTISKVTETRYYLQSGKIVRQLTKSFDERSWLNEPGSTGTPNKVVEDAAGNAYPDMKLAQELQQGEVDC